MRDLTNKLLTDGQFDEGDLTFTIGVDPVGDHLATNAIYHGRVSYPDAEELRHRQG